MQTAPTSKKMIGKTSPCGTGQNSPGQSRAKQTLRQIIRAVHWTGIHCIHYLIFV